MKRALMGLLLAVWMIGSAAMVVGQDDPFGSDLTGCDVGTLELIEAASPNVNYRAACEQFLACAAGGTFGNDCQFEVATRLLANCEVEDTFCRNEALLHVAALTIYGPFPYNWYRSDCSFVDASPFPNVIHLFAAEDYAGAISLLPPVSSSTFCHPMYHYSRGLIAEMLGMEAYALGSYTTAVELSEDFITPSLYSRGLLLGELGRITEASFDGEQLRRFLAVVAPDALPMAASLTDAYPVDMSPFSTWLAYPVALRTSFTVGSEITDLSLQPPIPVEIAEYPDLDRLVVIGIPPDEWTPPNEAALLSFQITSETEPVETVSFGINWSFLKGAPIERRYWGRQLIVEMNSDLMTIIQPGAEFEFFWSTTYMVVPPDRPDPRIDLGIRTCEGGVLSLVRPGAEIHTLYYPGLPLQEEPGIVVELQSGVYGVSLARITGGPVCIGTDAWWYVETEEGQSGWLPENHGNEYVMAYDYGSEVQLMYCPPSLPSRLIHSIYAVVTDAPGAGLIHETASNDAPIVGTLSPGDRVYLPGQSMAQYDERACIDGQVWWWVRTDDWDRGFIAESDIENYFLEPVPLTP